LEDIEKIYVNGVVVLEINLIRAILDESITLRKIVEEEINSGQTRLVIDLSKCHYIDSTFYGTIVMTSKRLIDIGYKLRVVEPAIIGQSIVINVNTSKVFDKYKTREEAIKSFDEDIQPNS
jgi:anti-anti-sigma regulatory factor